MHVQSWTVTSRLLYYARVPPLSAPSACQLFPLLVAASNPEALAVSASDVTSAAGVHGQLRSINHTAASYCSVHDPELKPSEMAPKKNKSYSDDVPWRKASAGEKPVPRIGNLNVSVSSVHQDPNFNYAMSILKVGNLLMPTICLFTTSS